ncbi:MAG: tetratricopeptide repeat protein, partial [Aurantibacter sp.]
IGAISTLIGWSLFDISPLHKLEEIANNQRDYQRKEQHLKYNQRMVERHLELGDSFLSAGQVDEAKTEFARALELDNYNIKAHFGKLKSEIFIPPANKAFDSEIAEKRLKLIQKENPDDPHIFSFLGDVNRINDKDKAMEYYRKAVNIDSSIASAYAGMAVIHDLDKEYDEALKMYLKAHSLSKWNQTYLNNLGYQYYQKGNYDQAIEYYEKLLSLNGEYALTHFTLASAYRLKGNLWYAFQYYEFLMKILDTKEVMDRKINNGQWFFHTDKGPVHFYELAMKKCYAYYGQALTAYLRYDYPTANRYIEMVRQLNSKEEYLVKIVMAHDIETLRDVQKSYSNSLDAFKSEYGL